jgi:predicted dehydrogenase
MSKTWNVGIMGCANIAERMVIPAFIASPYFDVKAVCSRTADKANRYALTFNARPIVGYDALINDTEIDVVYMPLPTGLHLEWGLKTLEAGKHILMEKSLAVNYADAQTLVNKAKEKGLLIQENFMFAFHRQLAVIKKLIADGAVGKLRCIRSSFGFPPFPDTGNIRYQPALGGGALLDAGAYTLKVAQLLLGFDLTVQAASLNFDPDKGVDIHGAIFLTDTQGVAVETAFGFDNYYQCMLEVWGSKGKITADRIFTAGPAVAPKILFEQQGHSETIEPGLDNHFLNLINDFAYTLSTGNFEAKYTEILSQARLLQEVADKAQKL